MSQELLYTSAPRGLKPGSRGFCTVMSTQGMPLNLAERLESLSGYRHVFSPPDPNAVYNPVVHSHFRITIGGQQLFILSRIADAGLDYSQRTNKIAHHVALLPHELPAGGPAWLLTQPGFMERSWQGEPRLLSAGRPVPKGNAGPAACRAWQAIAGDAGWGGVLAEGALTDPRRTIYLIFRPGTDVLALMAESLALVPPENRWNVSFSTYCAAIPPGVECQWRGVVEGSPEAKAARQAATAMVLDLTGPLGPPPASAFVEAARSGRSVATPRPAPIPPQASRSQAAPIPADNAAATQTVPPDLPPPSIYDLVSPPPAEARPPRMRLRGSGRGDLDERVPHRWPAWAVFAAAITLLILLAGAFGAGVMVGRGWVELASRDATSDEHSLPTNPHQPSTQADAQSAKRADIQTTPSSEDETSGAAARSPEQPKEAPGDQSGGGAPQPATSPSPTATGGEHGTKATQTASQESESQKAGEARVAQSAPAAEPERGREAPTSHTETDTRQPKTCASEASQSGGTTTAQLDSGATPNAEASKGAAIASGPADQNTAKPPAQDAAQTDDEQSRRVGLQSRQVAPFSMNLLPRGYQPQPASSPVLPVAEVTDLMLVGVPLDPKGNQFRLSKTKDGQSGWQCDYPQESSSSDPIPFGLFRFTDRQFMFEWDERSTEHAATVLLANSIILHKTGDKWTPLIQLRVPFSGPKLELRGPALRRSKIDVPLENEAGSSRIPDSLKSMARLDLHPVVETGEKAVTTRNKGIAGQQYVDLVRMTVPIGGAKLECDFMLDLEGGRYIIRKQSHNLTELPDRLNAGGLPFIDWQDATVRELDGEVRTREKRRLERQGEIKELKKKISQPQTRDAGQLKSRMDSLNSEDTRLAAEIERLTSIKAALNRLNCTVYWKIGLEVRPKDNSGHTSPSYWLCIAQSEEAPSE